MGFLEKDRVAVKTYKNHKEYKRDAKKMVRQGYHVVSTVSAPGKGCMALILWPQSTGITVTYELRR